MDYHCLVISYGDADHDTGLLVAGLSRFGFDAFEELPGRLLAYIPSGAADEAGIREWVISQRLVPEAFSRVEEKNWNEVWESNFPAVVIAGKCLVRAPFHPPDPQIPLELVIEPKMSFGTAHHETTSQVMELMLGMDWKGKTILDMGCGTGILAILAVKLGASRAVAVDNDPWAYENSQENVSRNETGGSVRVVCGDASVAKGKRFDAILANINRNILLQDMPRYAAALQPGGILILSGFYAADLPVLQQEAARLNLDLQRYITRNDWVAAVFSRI